MFVEPATSAVTNSALFIDVNVWNSTARHGHVAIRGGYIAWLLDLIAINTFRVIASFPLEQFFPRTRLGVKWRNRTLASCNRVRGVIQTN
jgi:hypothetical protein